MTLLIAQRAHSNVRMAAVSAITDGTYKRKAVRIRLKIRPSHDGCAVIGFAADYHHGTHLMQLAAARPAGTDAARFLAESQPDHPSVDLAYADTDDAKLQIAKNCERDGVILTCHRSFIQPQLESRWVVRRLARVEQRAVGGAGRGCAADRPLR